MPCPRAGGPNADQNSQSHHTIRKGTYRRPTDKRLVPRGYCYDCQKGFSEQTNSPTYRQQCRYPVNALTHIHLNNKKKNPRLAGVFCILNCSKGVIMLNLSSSLVSKGNKSLCLGLATLALFGSAASCKSRSFQKGETSQQKSFGGTIDKDSKNPVAGTLAILFWVKDSSQSEDAQVLVQGVCPEGAEITKSNCNKEALKEMPLTTAKTYILEEMAKAGQEATNEKNSITRTLEDLKKAIVDSQLLLEGDILDAEQKAYIKLQLDPLVNKKNELDDRLQSLDSKETKDKKNLDFVFRLIASEGIFGDFGKKISKEAYDGASPLEALNIFTPFLKGAMDRYHLELNQKLAMEKAKADAEKAKSDAQAAAAAKKVEIEIGTAYTILNAGRMYVVTGSCGWTGGGLPFTVTGRAQEQYGALANAYNQCQKVDKRGRVYGVSTFECISTNDQGWNAMVKYISSHPPRCPWDNRG